MAAKCRSSGLMPSGSGPGQVMPVTQSKGGSQLAGSPMSRAHDPVGAEARCRLALTALGQSQPFWSAILTASARLRVPVLAIADDR
jgi:hypothetical protein